MKTVKQGGCSVRRKAGLVIILFPVLAVSSCTERRDTPEHAVKKYFDYSRRLSRILDDPLMRAAIEKKDISGFTEEERKLLDDFPRLFVSETAYTVLVSAGLWYSTTGRYRIIDVKINDDRAKITVEANVKYALEDRDEFKKQRTVFNLRRENGKWLIADIGGVYHRFLQRIVDEGLKAFKN